MSLSVDSVVSVQILVAPQAPVARGFGVGLVLGVATVLPLSERIRTYTKLSGGVSVDFGSGTEEYKAAAAYFGQTPAPKQLKIGRQFLAAQAGQLRGAGVSALLAAYTGITNGGFDITINGTNRVITALDLSGAASLAAVATLIQTKLAAALAATTCTWDTVGLRFVITSPTTGTASIVLHAVAPTGGGSPTDASTILGLTAAAGATSAPGIAIETLTDALNASQIFDATFYGVALTAASSTQDQKDAMAWAEAAKMAFFYTTADPNAKLSAATSDLGYYAKNLGYVRTIGFYSAGSPYAALSGMARMFIVDFDQPNSTSTLKFKQLPGIAIDNLTETERLALEAKNLNYYTDVGGFPMVAQGVVASGRFFDEVHGLDWLQATMQNAVFTALATRVTKIPQTDEGVGILTQAAMGALNMAKSNGLLAPGVWKGQNLGEVKTGDFLPTGYYVYAQPVADQLTADRDLRKSPPISAIGIGGGAIHSAAITFTFQR